MIDWLMPLIPWWAWAGGGAGLVVLAWRFLGLRGAIAALGAVALAVSYRKGRDDQRARQKKDALDQHYKDLEKRNATEDTNRNRTPDARRKRLHDNWTEQ